MFIQSEALGCVIGWSGPSLQLQLLTATTNFLAFFFLLDVLSRFVLYSLRVLKSGAPISCQI